MTRAATQADLTRLRAVQGLLNQLRNVGLVGAALLVLPGLGDRRLLWIVLALFVAGPLLAKRSRAAAVAMVLLAAGTALYFELDYREALPRSEQHAAELERRAGEERPRTPGQELHERRAAEALRGLTALSRTAAWLWASYGVVLLGTVPVVLWLRRRAPLPAVGLSWRRRLALGVAQWRQRAKPRAVLTFGLALACFLLAAGPWLLELLLLYLRVEPPGFLSQVGGGRGWWRLATALGGVVGGLLLLTRAKRHATLSGASVRAIDPRPPHLLLRSFGDDVTPLRRTDDQNAWQRSAIAPSIWTLEETIEKLLGVYGPVIAIGRPGEPVPPAGAAREYVAHDEWQVRVQAMIGEARVVVVILGETEGLTFEYRALRDLGALEKLILVFPPRESGALTALWQRFALVAVPGAGQVDVTRALAAWFRRGREPEIVSCRWRDDEDCYRLALEHCLRAVREGEAGHAVA